MIRIIFNRKPMFDGELFIDANQSLSSITEQIKRSFVICPDKTITFCTYLEVKTLFMCVPRMYYSWELETWTYDEDLMKDVEC